MKRDKQLAYEISQSCEEPEYYHYVDTEIENCSLCGREFLYTEKVYPRHNDVNKKEYCLCLKCANFVIKFGELIDEGFDFLLKPKTEVLKTLLDSWRKYSVFSMERSSVCFSCLRSIAPERALVGYCSHNKVDANLFICTTCQGEINKSIQIQYEIERFRQAVEETKRRLYYIRKEVENVG